VIISTVPETNMKLFYSKCTD